MTVHECNKEDKIDTMEKKLDNLDKVVLQGTNGDSLVSMARQTRDRAAVTHKDVKTLLKFQTEIETEQRIKERLHEKNRIREAKRAKRQQWFIGLLVGTVMSLITIIIALVTVKNTI